MQLVPQRMLEINSSEKQTSVPASRAREARRRCSLNTERLSHTHLFRPAATRGTQAAQATRPRNSRLPPTDGQAPLQTFEVGRAKIFVIVCWRADGGRLNPPRALACLTFPEILPDSALRPHSLVVRQPRPANRLERSSGNALADRALNPPPPWALK